MTATWRRWADVPPTEAWTPADPATFKLPEAKHLLRRAAFGAAPGEAEALVEVGLNAAVAGLIRGDRQKTLQRDREFEALGREAATTEPNGVDNLRRWWLYLMCNSGHPLREKMALFWHWHFATGAGKVGSPARMFKQNCLFRHHALRSFETLLTEASRDPAMLIWLDSNSNTKQHANENFAREVMELFTLGVGNYTETDVREAARAFTGCHLDEAEDCYVFHADEHDNGEKTILEHSGNFDGDNVLKILLDQRQAALFLAGKVARYLMTDEQIPVAVVEPLAKIYRDSGYDTAELVATILASKAFYASVSRRARIKTPVEFLLGAERALLGEVLEFTGALGRLSAMGMALFAPPDVKGWRGGRGWLSHAALVERLGFAEQLAMGFSGNMAQYDIRDRKIVAPGPQGNGQAVPDLKSGIGAPGAETVEAVAQATATADFASEPAITKGDREALGKPSEKRVRVSIARPARPEIDPFKDVSTDSLAACTRWLDAMTVKLFDAPLAAPVRQKLLAYIAEADGHPLWLRQRCREALHAMLSLPDYQLN